MRGFHRCLKEDLAGAFATAEIRDAEIHFQKGDLLERGATWTYIPTDQPFGTLGKRIMKGYVENSRKHKADGMKAQRCCCPFLRGFCSKCTGHRR